LSVIGGYDFGRKKIKRKIEKKYHIFW
jgi:hypothetical protein